MRNILAMLAVLSAFGTAWAQQTAYTQTYDVVVDSAEQDTVYFGNRPTAFWGSFVSPDTNAINPSDNVFDDDLAVLQFRDVSDDSVAPDTCAAYVKSLDKYGNIVQNDSAHVIDTDFSGGAALVDGKTYSFSLSGLTAKKNGIAIIFKRIDHESAVRTWRWTYISN